MNINKEIQARYEAFSPKLKRAARFVLDQPEEVALQSMRSAASHAGVHPSTMLRLARELGFDRYNDFRDAYQVWLRDRRFTFSDRARRLVGLGKHDELAVLINEMLGREIANLQTSFSDIGLERFAAARDLLNRVDRIFVLGLRSLFPAAFYFHYACRAFTEKTVLLEGPGGTFADELRSARRGDGMLAISYRPYAQDALRTVKLAAARGAQIVAITDSPVSPIVPYTTVVLEVSNAGASLFPSIVPAVAIVQTLVAMLVAESGEATLSALAKAEEQLRAFQVYVPEE